MVVTLGQNNAHHKSELLSGAFLKDNGNKHVIIITGYFNPETKLSEMEETMKSFCNN